MCARALARLWHCAVHVDLRARNLSELWAGASTRHSLSCRSLEDFIIRPPQRNLCLRHRECLGYHSPPCTSHRTTINVGPIPHPPVSPGDGDDRRVDQILLHSTHTYPSIHTTVRRPSEESLARGRTDTHHQKGRRHARSGRLGGVLHGLLAHDAPRPPLPTDSQEASLIQLRSQLHELDKDECVAGCTVTV